MECYSVIKIKEIIKFAGTELSNLDPEKQIPHSLSSVVPSSKSLDRSVQHGVT